MSVFRRRRKDDDDGEPVDAVDEADADGADDGSGPAAAEPAPFVRPSGPWDVEDVPADAIERIDLGGLQIPVLPGTEVRVDVNSDGAVVAATLVQDGGSVQVNAFAAPRTAGIWAEVRAEIATALAQGGGRSAEAEGTYGIELRAAVPTGEQGALAPARFVGIDGPRWFVRALVTGPAAVDPEQAASLEAALRQVVVVRGGEAMVVRDPLPLALPKQVAEQAAAAAQHDGGAEPLDAAGAQAAAGAQDAAGEDAAGPDADALRMPERGPEITETR